MYYEPITLPNITHRPLLSSETPPSDPIPLPPYYPTPVPSKIVRLVLHRLVYHYFSVSIFISTSWVDKFSKVWDGLMRLRLIEIIFFKIYFRVFLWSCTIKWSIVAQKRYKGSAFIILSPINTHINTLHHQVSNMPLLSNIIWNEGVSVGILFLSKDLNFRLILSTVL